MGGQKEREKGKKAGVAWKDRGGLWLGGREREDLVMLLEVRSLGFKGRAAESQGRRVGLGVKWE